MAIEPPVKTAPDAAETPATDKKSLKVKIPIDTENILKTAAKKKKKKKKSKKAKAKVGDALAERRAAGATTFPKNPLLKCIRIPQGIIEQNAGHECKVADAAGFAGVAYNGDIGVEIASAVKYGLLERSATGMVKPSDLARQIVRPKTPNDKLEALRESVLKAPVISDVYKHYRGENLPEDNFLLNTVIDIYGVPKEKALFFLKVFKETLSDAELLDMVGDQTRILDVTHTAHTDSGASDSHLKKLSKGVVVGATDTCFVMMPFAPPLGDYYSLIYEPAIQKAKLRAVRADDDIFGTGKIIDQIFQGISNARVLVAELTSRNANVFYELGLAHALKKPVVLVCGNKADIAFDVGHVRVIYYDMTDPFWGEKLVDKVAENIISAMKDPKDAILFP